MFTQSIRRFTVLAMLAAAPAIGVADGMVATGQANNTQKQQAGTTAQGGNAGAAGQAQKSGGGQAADAIYMLVPVAVAVKDNSMKSGCWARIFSRANYAGDVLTLTGPLSIADMGGPFGLNWDDKVDSVEVGPKATLTVYDNEQFRDQVAQFKPGQKVADISKPLGFFDEFASVRLTCAK